jgi:tetratricopeptide (TPR) repeat protein
MPRRTKSEELLDFEIAFYEKLLRAYPDFVDALIPLGNAYTRRGLHSKGLEVDLRLTTLRAHDPLTWYNLACSYSLLKRLEESLTALRRSIELGYTDFAYVQKDPDLANVRQSPQYRQLLESLVSPHAGKTPPASL